MDHSFDGAGDVPTSVPPFTVNDGLPDVSAVLSFPGVRGTADIMENDDVDELPRNRGELCPGERNPAPEDSPGVSPCPASSCEGAVAAAAAAAAALLLLLLLPPGTTTPPFSLALRRSVARSGLLADPGERNMERLLFCSSMSVTDSGVGGTTMGLLMVCCFCCWRRC